MANERRGERRQGRPGGGGSGDFRPRRGGAPRGSSYRGGAPRGSFGDEGPRAFTPRQDRGSYAPRGAYGQRGADEGGMSIRIDPRRLSLLKELAAAEGLRPGQLVQRWIEERLDAERSGQAARIVSSDPRVAALEAALAALAARIDEVTQRLQLVEAPPMPVGTAGGTTQLEAPRRRRGRPPKTAGAEGASTRAQRAAVSRNGHVGLHDEIIAVIQERGPSTAAELATAIRERGRYRPPRSAKPLDAATVNSRVSNPVYRARFRRAQGRISLAD